MFDKFADYIQYLLPSAFKRQKKQNQLLIYCRATGKLYDTLLRSILRLREETILATCSPDMLEVFGHDYDMPRMQGETSELYRRRLQMKALTAATAGTRQGILYALASVGYDNCTIVPFYVTDPDRWAEIRINIFTPGVDADNPIAFKCVVAEVLKVKQAGTLPHWRFYYPAEFWHTDINSIQAAVRFTLYIQFWRDCIYNGQNQYDGELQYDARRNYRTNALLINRLLIYTEQQAGNTGIRMRAQVQNGCLAGAAVKSCHSISFWHCEVYDGQCQYDSVLQYDATRRYGLRMTAADRLGLYTAQTIQYGQHMIHVGIPDKVDAKAGIKNYGYRIKEPEPGCKGRMQIHMEVLSAQEKISNVYIETCRNVAYFDGTLRFDGTAKYDALYKKEEIE